QYAVGRAHALDRVEQNRPDAAEHDDGHLLLVVDAHDDHEHGHDDGRRNRAQELEGRLGEHAQDAARTDHESQQNAEDDGGDDSDDHTGDARDDIGGEAFARPDIAEDAEDLERFGHEKIVVAKREKPPEDQQNDREPHEIQGALENV